MPHRTTARDGGEVLGAERAVNPSVATDSEQPKISLRTSVATLATNAKYRRLFAARSISIFGNQFSNLALAFGILALHGTGKAALLGLVFASASLATVIFVLLGGVLSDRTRRDVLIISSDVVSGITLATLAVLFATHHATPAALIGLSFIQGAAAAVRFPALTGLLPAIVEPDEIQPANGLLRLSANVSSIAGPALAALLVSTAGTPAALGVDAVAYFASVLFISGLGLSKPIASGHSMFTELRHGWHAFIEHTWVWAIVAGFCVYNACSGGVFSVLAPVVMKTHFHGAASWGLILTVGAIGSVLGSGIAIRLRPARPMVVGILGCVPMVVFTFGLITPIPVVALAAIMAISSVGTDIFGVLWESALQLHIEADIIGRVSSYDWLGSLLATPIGLAIAGILADHLGVTSTLTGAGVICGSILVLLLLLPSIRTMTNATPPATS